MPNNKVVYVKRGFNRLKLVSLLLFIAMMSFLILAFNTENSNAQLTFITTAVILFFAMILVRIIRWMYK
jgi:hypothetical protein